MKDQEGFDGQSTCCFSRAARAVRVTSGIIPSNHSIVSFQTWRHTASLCFHLTIHVLLGHALQHSICPFHTWEIHQSQVNRLPFLQGSRCLEHPLSTLGPGTLTQGCETGSYHSFP